MSRNTVLGTCISTFKLPIKVPECAPKNQDPCSRASTMPVENYGRDGDSLLDYIKLRCHFGISYNYRGKEERGKKRMRE